MAPAERECGALLLVAELLVGGVAVTLEQALVSTQQRECVLLPSARGIAVDDRGRIQPCNAAIRMRSGAKLVDMMAAADCRWQEV